MGDAHRGAVGGPELERQKHRGIATHAAQSGDLERQETKRNKGEMDLPPSFLYLGPVDSAGHLTHPRQGAKDHSTVSSGNLVLDWMARKHLVVRGCGQESLIADNSRK